jgi:hypothetical protein
MICQQTMKSHKKITPMKAFDTLAVVRVAANNTRAIVDTTSYNNVSPAFISSTPRHPG